MSVLRDLLVDLEEKIDTSKQRTRAYEEPIHVDAYAGHGRGSRALLRGRVVEDLPIEAEADQGLVKNVRDMLERYASDEVAGAELAVTLDGRRHTFRSNHEGYYSCELEWAAPPNDRSIWRSIEIELLSPHGKSQKQTRFESWVQVPDERSLIGIICDIDDTIITTHAHNLLAHTATVLAHNAHTREVIAGMPELLRALVEREGCALNPIFLLSSSPWNMHGLFSRIFELHGVPRGTFFLKDFGLERDHFFKPTSEDHKLDHARRLLTTYPELDFVLFGDSGQQDMAIYEQLLREHPGRIRACYIHDVSPDLSAAQIEATDAMLAQSLFSEVAVCCEESAQMAEHAHEIGLITADDLARVRAARRAPSGAPETPPAT